MQEDVDRNFWTDADVGLMKRGLTSMRRVGHFFFPISCVTLQPDELNVDQSLVFAFDRTHKTFSTRTMAGLSGDELFLARLRRCDSTKRDPLSGRVLALVQFLKARSAGSVVCV